MSRYNDEGYSDGRRGGGGDRGGYDRHDDRRGGGYDDRRGGYDDRRGHDDRRGGNDRHDDRRGGDQYDRRGGDQYNDRRDDDRRDNRDNRGGYDRDRNQGGFDNRDRNQGGNQRSGGGGYQDNDRFRQGSGSDRGFYEQSRSTGSSSSQGGYGNRSQNRSYNPDQLANRMGKMQLRGRCQINQGPDLPKSNVPVQSDWTQKPDVVNVPKKELEYRNQKFAQRPEKLVYDMKCGTKLQVTTNYATLSITKDTLLVRYNISFYAMTNKGGRKPVTKREVTAPRFWELVRANEKYFEYPEHYIYNDVNILLVEDGFRLKDAEKTHEMFDGRGKKSGEVHIVAAGSFHLTGYEEDEDKKKYIVSLVDAIASSAARKDPQNSAFIVDKNAVFVRNAEQNEFPVRITFNLPCGLQALTGLHMAVKMDCRGGPMVNFDLTHGVFTNPCYPIIRLLSEQMKGSIMTDEEYDEFLRNGLPRFTISAANCEKMSKMLKDRIMMKKVPTMNRTVKFKFNGIKTRGGNVITAGMFRFDHKYPDGTVRNMNMVEYYAEHHDFHINPNLPIVQAPLSRTHNNYPCYPLESVYLHDTPARFKGAIPLNVLNPMVKGISFPPQQRLKNIRELCNQNPSRKTPALVNSDQPIMKNHGIEIGRELLDVNAVRLPAPTLMYGNGQSFFDKANDGVWDNATSERTYTLLAKNSYKTKRPRALVPMLLLVPQNPVPNPPKGDDRLDLGQFNKLFQTVRSYDLQVFETNGIIKPADTITYSNVEALISWIGQAKSFVAQMQKEADARGDVMHLVPIILAVFEKRWTSMKNADYNLRSEYANIKQICDGETGIHMQGILLNSYMRIDTKGPCSISHNIALKIFGKIGAIHYELERDGRHKSWTEFTKETEPTLVLSIDVTHPSAQARQRGSEMDKLSVASIVGNIDIAMTRFRETCRVQNPGQEQVVSMINEIQERITEFSSVSKIKPAHIVVYRDGIGETDFQRILFEELSNINMAVQNMGFEKEPTITYIVVTKRHHTRFFGIKEEDVYGEVGNLRPGTMIEDTITHKKYFDFFLQSHYGPLGTSRPAHYYVLHDTWAPSPAFWQIITYALCYNYCRQSRSLSQPGPLMYAHLAAARAKDRLNAIITIWKEREGRRLDINSTRDMEDLNEALKVHSNIEGMAFV